MKFFDKFADICICEQKKDVNVGKIVFKTAAITAAVLAFVPTVIKINKGKGFDAYGLLSHVKYEKKTDETGRTDHDVRIDLIDLERYGIDRIDLKKESKEENEDSSGIA